MLRRGLVRAGDRLLVLAGLATVLALLVPSHVLARRSDLVLAVLVLFTALGIAPAQLASLTAHKRVLGVLVAAPFVALVPLAWLISRLFSGAVRDGVLALGVSSTEVAAVGLVALAGGSAVLALGALAGSLVVAALLGPVLLGLLAGGATDVAVGALVVRFALVVLLPLAVGLAARTVHPRLERAGESSRAWATLAVVLLVYAAMSGAGEGGDLLPAAAASVLFLCRLRPSRAAPGPSALSPAGAPGDRGAVSSSCATSLSRPRSPARRSVRPRRRSPGCMACSMLLLGAAAAHTCCPGRWRAPTAGRQPLRDAPAPARAARAPRHVHHAACRSASNAATSSASTPAASSGAPMARSTPSGGVRDLEAQERAAALLGLGRRPPRARVPPGRPRNAAARGRP